MGQESGHTGSTRVWCMTHIDLLYDHQRARYFHRKHKLVSQAHIHKMAVCTCVIHQLHSPSTLTGCSVWDVAPEQQCPMGSTQSWHHTGREHCSCECNYTLDNGCGKAATMALWLRDAGWLCFEYLDKRMLGKSIDLCKLLITWQRPPLCWKLGRGIWTCLCWWMLIKFAAAPCGDHLAYRSTLFWETMHGCNFRAWN